MSKLTVGVDVSQNYLDVAVACISQEEPLNLGKFENTIKGRNKIFKKVSIQAKRMGAQEVCLAIEPSGGYEIPLATMVFDRGWTVYMTNPCKVKHWAASQGIRAKTDTVDARILVRYAQANTSIPDWSPMPSNISDLDDIIKRREELEQSLRREANRLHALNARGITKGPAVDSLERTISWLQEEIKRLSGNIDQHIEEDPELKKHRDNLKTIPGIGKVNSSIVLFLMCQWNHISKGQGSDKSITAYLGLDPVPHQSGTSVYRHERISRKGNPFFRKHLYLAALGGAHGKNILAVFYQRLVSRGKNKKLALIACARKILAWAWAIFRSNTSFQPSRLFIT